MPSGVTTADQIVREDLSDVYINLDQRKTPLLTRFRAGDNLENVKLFSWALEGYDGRMVTGIPENKDADTFESDVQNQLYGRSQKFWRYPHVTVEANMINRAPADFGKYNGQVRKKTVEQKRDIETRLGSDLDSRDDDGVTGREFMGLGRFINDTVSVGVSGAALPFGDTQTAVPPAFRTPTSQIYTGALYVTASGVVSDLTFNEEILNGMMQNRFDNLGMTQELSVFCDVAFKRHMDRIVRYAKNLTSYTPVGRVQMAPLNSNKYVMTGADLFETVFGLVDINVVPWLPRTSTGALSGRAYFLDMERLRMRYSGLYLTHTPIDDKGAGPRGLIQSILGPQYDDPRAHLKVDPNVISTGT